jgi:hypothetical protein
VNLVMKFRPVLWGMALKALVQGVPRGATSLSVFTHNTRLFPRVESKTAK